MSPVKNDNLEGIPGAAIPEQAIKEMLTGSTASSLPSPHADVCTRFLILARSLLSRSLEQATRDMSLYPNIGVKMT